MRRSVFLPLSFALMAASPEPSGSTLVVPVEGFRSNQGQVICDLFAAPEGFPIHREKAARTVQAPVVNGKAECRFDQLTPGTYAVSLFHDENGNGRLDTNWLGIPREGLGSSRNAKGFFGPPSFADASFPYPGPEANQTVRLRYL